MPASASASAPPRRLARIFHRGRARVSCDAARWEGGTTLRADAREEEQRSQRAAAQLNRVCSARYKLDWALEANKVSIHAVLRGRGKRPGERSGLDLPAAALSLLAGLALAPGPGRADTLTVQVTQAAGQALADAVAMLEPKGGRAPHAKPMSGVQISQAKRQFSPRVTVITVGTSVAFPNFDTVRHQVYSFSEAKRFELQLYAGVPQSPVLFDKPGIAVLGCNIHDKMSAWVVVADTPWFAASGADGLARIDGAPAGQYVLRVWHPGLPAGSAPIGLPVTLDGTAQRIEARLALATE